MTVQQSSTLNTTKKKNKVMTAKDIAKLQKKAAEHGVIGWELMTPEQMIYAIKLKTGEIDVTDVVVPDNFKFSPGRPVVPGSVRQIRLAALEQKKAEYAAKGIEVKRGRPAEPGSKRQQEMMDKDIRRAERIANGESIGRGRPTDPNSQRQAKVQSTTEKRKAAYMAMVAAGKINIDGTPIISATLTAPILHKEELITVDSDVHDDDLNIED